MKKIFIIACSLCLILGQLSLITSASDITGGSIGETVEFDDVGELLEYIENERWQDEMWYDPARQSTKIEYLKKMNSELFLPLGYADADIEKIKIDDVMVWVYLADGKLLNYWFTEYEPNKKPTEICKPTEFRLLPGTDGVWDVPEVYNIYEHTVYEHTTVPRPAECKNNGEDEYFIK